MKKVILPLAVILWASVGWNAIQYDDRLDQEYKIVELESEIVEKDKKYKELEQMFFNDKSELEAQKKILELRLEKKEHLEKVEIIRQDIIEIKEEKQVPVSRSGTNVIRTLFVEATAYTSFCDTGCIGITSTGVDVKENITFKGHRIVAVDPKVIPLGSLIKVYPNDREPFLAYAKDTGGAIKGNKIDLLISVNNEALANKFGRQKNIKVEILK